MSLTFNRDFEPRHGEAVPVAPGVRRVTAPNRGPFTFAGTNTFIIGYAELAILDPGPADPAHIAAILHAVGTARVSHILVSHAHADHVSAAPLLQEATGAPILAADPPRRARPINRGSVPALDAAADAQFRPDRVLADDGIVEGPDFRLQAIASPGHASDHLAFALLGQDLIFSGDHVMGWATSVVAPPDGSMRDYIDSLDRLLGRPEDFYLPAHGGEIRNARAYVRALRAHRKMREQAILDRLRRGDHTIRDLVRSIYRGLDLRLVPAASLSTLAHLEDLVGRGLAATEGGPSLSGRYWPSASDGGSTPESGEAGGAAGLAGAPGPASGAALSDPSASG